MVDVPQAEPGRTSLSGTSPVYGQPTATPDMFGARQARNLAKAGMSVLEGGLTIREYTLRQQDKKNRALARDTMLKAMLDVEKLEGEIYSKSGAEALESRSAGREGLLSTRKKWGQELSGDALNYFYEMYDEQSVRSFKGFIRHETQETNKYEEATLAGEAELNSRRADVHRKDFSEVEGYQKKYEDSLLKTEIYRNLPAEAREARLIEDRDKFHVGRVETLIAEDPGTAEAYLKHFKDSISPEVYAKLAKKNEAILLSEKGRQLAEVITSTAKNEAEMREMMELHSGDKELVKNIKYWIDIEVQRKKQLETALSNQKMNNFIALLDDHIINSMKTPGQDAPPELTTMLNSMPMEQRGKALKVLKDKLQGAWEPDAALYFQALEESYDDPHAFNKLDLDGMKPLIGEDYHKKLVKRKEEVTRELVTGTALAEGVKTRNQLEYLKEKFVELGIAGKTEDNAKARNDYYRNFFEVLGTYKPEEQNQESTWDKIMSDFTSSYAANVFGYWGDDRLIHLITSGEAPASRGFFDDYLDELEDAGAPSATVDYVRERGKWINFVDAKGRRWYGWQITELDARTNKMDRILYRPGHNGLDKISLPSSAVPVNRLGE
jgi:hypothetical protein